MIFIGTIIIAIYAGRRFKKNPGIYKKVLYKFQVWGWSTGLVGLLLGLFREVGAIYIGSRAWMILWLIAIVVWLGFIIKTWIKIAGTKEAKLREESEYKKWLPENRKK